MKMNKTQIVLCMASFCALMLLALASPAAFASATQQATAQNQCPLLIEWSTDASSHGKVSILQRQLRAIGKEDVGSFGPGNGGVDGIFGPVTLKAVKHFQSTHGLDPDGKVGPLTWAALGGCGQAPPTKCETHPDAC